MPASPARIIPCVLLLMLFGGFAAAQTVERPLPPAPPAQESRHRTLPVEPPSPDPAPLPDNPRPRKALRFICVTTCADEPFFQPVAQGAHDAAELMNVNCDFVGTKAVDIPRQVEMVTDALNQGYDGIAINVIDPTAFNPVIAQARKSGIPVVAFNVNAQKKDRLATVAQDLYAAGRAAAEAAAEDIPLGSHVLMTVHSGEPGATDARYQGITDGLKDRNLVWTNVVCGTSAEETQRLITEQLQADPQVRAIFATGLDNTEGAGRAVENGFRPKEIIVAGFDVSPEILRLLKLGAVTFTVDQQPYAQGFYPVVQLTLAKRYGIQPVNIDTGTAILRSEDADAYLRWSRRQVRQPR